MYKGLLVNSIYDLHDLFLTYFVEGNAKDLITNYLADNVDKDVTFNVVILKHKDDTYSLLREINFNAFIDYREPSIPAGEEDNWYLLLSNDPSHFQVRSSGMVVYKDSYGEADESCELLFTTFTEEQCNQFNVPYTTLDI